MGQTGQTVRCSRCNNGVAGVRVDRLLARHGVGVQDLEQFEVRVLCDECNLAVAKRGRWLETVLLVVLVLGGLGLLVGEMLG